jgi:hypothetical protein
MYQLLGKINAYMKIRYRTLTRSTELSQPDLIGNILNELNKPGYTVVKQRNGSVEFNYNIWRLSSRNEVFYRVDGGVFEITASTQQVVFSYYISATFEILATIAVIIVALTQDHQLFIFLAFIWLMFIIRTVSVKKAGKQMMTNVCHGF